MELARETACHGTLVEEELGSRETLSFGFPGRASLRWLSGGRPPAFVSLALGGVAREPRTPSTPEGFVGVGWAAWPVSVQISEARPPHPHATPPVMSGPAWLRQGSSYYYLFIFSSSEIKVGLGAQISAPGGCLAKQFSELMSNLRRVHAEKVLTGQQGCGLPFPNRPEWKAGVRGPRAPALIRLQVCSGLHFLWRR